MQLQNLQKPRHLVTTVAGGIVVLVGILVLSDWYFNVNNVKQGLIHHYATMKANAALCFLLSGLLLLLLQITRNFLSPRQIYLRVAQFCAVVIAAFGLITIIEYLFNLNFGIDELLFKDTAAVMNTSHPGRMGFNAALNFLLIGSSKYLLIQPKNQRYYWYAQGLVIIVACISLQVVMSYVYQDKIIFGLQSYTTTMTLPAALTFTVLSVGILWLNPHQGLMRVVMSDGYGGLIARRLLLPAIVLPFVVGCLIMKCIQAAIYDVPFGISLFAIVLMMIFGVLIWQSAIVIDRLSRKQLQIQTALKLNEEKLHSFFNANMIGTLFGDIYGGIHQANDKFLSMIGYTREDLALGRLNWHDVTPIKYLELDQQAIASAKESIDGACVPFQKEYICKDGSYIPVLVGFVLVGEEREESIAFILDLSEREQTKQQIIQLNEDLQSRLMDLQKAEKALSLGYKRLNLLFQIANSLLSGEQPAVLIDDIFQKLAEQIGLDAYCHFLIENNSQVMRLVAYQGMTAEMAKQIELVNFGEKICGIVAQDRRAITVENVQQSTDQATELIRSIGFTAYYSYPLIARDKLLGTLSFGSRSQLYFTDNQLGMMQAVCDQVAIAMERSNLVASLKLQTEELQETNRLKDEFITILSHELRSPLNSILGWAQILRHRQLNPEQIAQGLETIERNAKLQNHLVGDLLDISHTTRGKLQLNFSICNLVLIINLAIESVRPTILAKEIDFRISLQPSEFLVNGDSDRLQQVIWNLLANAIKFTPRGGSVEIKLTKVAIDDQKIIAHPQKPLVTNYAKIEIVDTGMGISADFLPYVFDRFRQENSSKTRTHGGLGLGLALVLHLAELHGGTIDAESAGEHEGAIFTVKLPLLETSQELQYDNFNFEI